MSEDRFQLQRLLEAILFASSEPLTVDALVARMPEGADIPGLLQEIRDIYANRGVTLTPVEDRWCFRTAPDLSSKFHIEQKVERKLTRAAVETMAIIAYHQPVTRAEIEEIRGVAISKGTLDNLLEAGWIKPKGRRQTPGRPVTWVTTEGFLEHFGLESCDALPGVEELRAAGLLDSRNNSATLGVQGTLPPGADAEDGDDESDEAVVADDAYEADVLARLEGEGAEAVAEAAHDAAGEGEVVEGADAADEDDIVDGAELVDGEDDEEASDDDDVDDDDDIDDEADDGEAADADDESEVADAEDGDAEEDDADDDFDEDDDEEGDVDEASADEADDEADDDEAVDEADDDSEVVDAEDDDTEEDDAEEDEADEDGDDAEGDEETDEDDLEDDVADDEGSDEDDDADEDDDDDDRRIKKAEGLD